MRSSTFLLLGAGALVQGNLFGQTDEQAALQEMGLRAVPAAASASIVSAISEVEKFATVSGYSALESAMLSRANEFVETATATQLRALQTIVPDGTSSEDVKDFAEELLGLSEWSMDIDSQLLKDLTDKKEYMPKEQQDAFVKAYENMQDVVMAVDQETVDKLSSASTTGVTKLLGGMIAVGVAVVMAL